MADVGFSLVLVHSPSVGPSTWRPVADRAAAQGVAAVVPDLRRIAEGGPPYWPRVAAAVSEAISGLPEADPVVLAGHSNAGLFLPVVADSSPRPVVGAVFVDASLPADGPDAPVAPPEFLTWLQDLAGPQRRLPRWSDWWGEGDLAAVLPDPVVRAGVVADQPTLPLDYYEQRIPVPDSWAGVRCAYLQFNAAYDEQAAQAARAGWPLVRLAGEHLHQVVDPGSVTATLLELARAVAAPVTARLRPGPSPSGSMAPEPATGEDERR